MTLRFTPEAPPAEAQGQEILRFNPEGTKDVPAGAVQNRAVKYDFALGEDSPGVPSIAAQLQSGNENNLTDILTQRKAIQWETQKQDLISRLLSSASPETSQQDLDFLMGMSAVDAEEVANANALYNRDRQSPNAILETEYGKKFMRTVVNNDKTSSFFKAEQENPEQANQYLDAFEWGAARNTVAAKLAEEADEAWKNESLGQKALDIGGTLVPVWSNYRLSNVVKQAPATSLIPGTNIQEQISYLHSLSPDEFAKQAKAAVDSIPNTLLRSQFAHALLKFGDSDAGVANLNTTLDVIDTATGVGALAKAGVKAGARAAARRAASVEDGPSQTLRGVLKGALKSSARSDVDLAEVAEKTGMFRESALLKMVKGAKDLADRIPAISNPRNWYDGGTNLAREVQERLQKRASNRALYIEQALESPTVARTSEQRVADVAEAALRDLEADVRPSGTILDLDNGKPVYTVEQQSIDALKAQQDEWIQRLKTAKETQNLPVIKAAEKTIKDIAAKISASTNPTNRGTDFVLNPAERNLANVNSITIKIGDKNGLLFDNQAIAERWKQDNLASYKDAVVVQHGNKYYVELTKDLPDQIDNFKHADVPLQDKAADGWLNALLGGFRSPAHSMGEASTQGRLVATHGREEFVQALQEILKPIGSLAKNQKKELEYMLKKNRDFVNDVTGERGRYFNSQLEFEDAFRNKFNKLPTEQQVDAYNAYIQANDLDWVVRSAGWYRDKVRAGIENFGLSFTFDGANVEGAAKTRTRVKFNVEGREVKDVPRDLKYRFNIAVVDEDNGSVNVFSNFTESLDNIASIDTKLANGYKVIQVADANLRVPNGRGMRGVAFVVIKDFTRERLSIEGPYKAGGHVVNRYSHYVKQGNVSTGSDGKKYYTGDTAVFSAPTAKVAKARAEAAETARQMLRANDPALDAFVSKHLGMSGDAYRKLFRPTKNRRGELVPGLDLEVPFVATRAGERTVGNARYAQLYGDQFVDTVNSPYNLYTEMDRTFSGERESGNIPVLVEEGGVKQVLDDGSLLDPLETLERAAQNMVDLRTKRDFILRSAQDWVADFAHLLKKPDERSITDPVSTMAQADYIEGISWQDRRNADLARRQIMTFAGSLNKEERWNETIAARLLDLAYEKGGARGMELMETWMIPYVTNPMKLPNMFRKMATHLKLGFGNPVQLFLQAQTTANIVAISPRNGLHAGAAYPAIRAALLSPTMLKGATSRAALVGWKADEFTEMMESMVRNGWHKIGGTHSVVDELAVPQMVRRNGKTAADASLFFFREGEKIPRTISWATAYLDWKRANPGKALDRAAEAYIIKRADALNNNMSSANNAMWQRGPVAIPSQFFAYNIRLMESYFGKTLTKTEKARLFATHAALYGVPVATGGAIAVAPVYDIVKQSLMERGIKYDDTGFEAVMEGIPSVILEAMGGPELDVGARYGTGGITVFRDWIRDEKGIGEIALGASGSVAVDVAASLAPAFKAVLGLATDSPDDTLYYTTPEMVVKTIQNISGVSNAIKLIWAANTGKWMSKYGRVVDNVETGDAFWMALTGANTQQINEMYIMKDIHKDFMDARRAASLQLNEMLAAAFRNREDGDDRQEALRKFRAIAVASGFDQNEITTLIRNALRNQSEPDQVRIERQFEEDLRKKGIKN